MLECDVLVVGAGPAGSSAAFFSRYLDTDDKYETILLERLDDKKYPKYHDVCGEGVSEDLFRDISPIKPTHIVEKIRKLRELWPGDIEIETPLKGYIIDRPQFFGSIIDEFTRLDGKHIKNSLVDFSEKKGTVKVKLSDGEFIKTKYLIAADGANSYIRKKLGIEKKTKMLLQYILDVEPEEHDTIIFEYDEKWKGDYKWTFPHGNSTKIGFPYSNYKEKVEGKILRKQARLVGFGGIENNVYGNILLVGDAACQNNPITKGGIRPGMVAGKLAAEAIINEGPVEYDKRWKESDFASPIFLQAFEKIRNMTNDELKRHIEPFKNGVNLFSMIKVAIFYRKYLDLYNAYDLSNKVGW